MYVGFINLEKAYDRVNREVLYQVVRMYDVQGKLLGGIKSMYIHSSACVRVKGGDSKQFKKNSGDRGVSCPPGCSMYIWLE